MADSQVKLSLPPSWFFKFPPDDTPKSLTPPLAFDEAHIRSPFNIDPDIYNKALNPALPVIFAITYILVAATVNRINRSRDYRPYWISETKIFSAFVILHNVGLAIYSAVTCAAMLRAVSVSFPGFFGPNGLAGAADALCKMHGPRGFGDAITFEPTSLKWLGQNRLIQLAPDGLIPDSTDVGRIWNEGLAFWGWLFYISKFYEVVDTMIILAKGKRSSTLQTYHHAGAMLCMWSGIRYMSPPIWMFVTVNAGIHAMMYTYYTLSALKFGVPGRIKYLITSLQILQFLVGASYATLHLFVSYKVPVSVHQTLASILSSVPPAASEAAAAFAAIADDLFTSASIGSMAAEATAHPSSWLMKLLYRAGGAEGLAETVHNSAGDLFGNEYAMSPNMPSVSPVEEVQYRTELQEVRCLDTSGQAFAIWLNVVYLAPLTALFVRFFIKTYVFRTPNSRVDQKEMARSASDAVDETKSTAEAIGKAVEKKIGEALEGTKEAMRSTGTEGYRELVDKGLTSDEAMQDAVDEAADADRAANLKDPEGNGEGALYGEDAARIGSHEHDVSPSDNSIANLIRRGMRIDGGRSRSNSLDSEERDDKENQPPVRTKYDEAMIPHLESKANGNHDTFELSRDSLTSLDESGVLVDISAYDDRDIRDLGEETDNIEPSDRSSQAQQSKGLLIRNEYLSTKADFGQLIDTPSKSKSKSSEFDKVWFGSERITPKKRRPPAETSESFSQDHSEAEGTTSSTSHYEIYPQKLKSKASSEEDDARPKPLFATSSHETSPLESQGEGNMDEAPESAHYSDVVTQNESSPKAEAEHIAAKASMMEDANPEGARSFQIVPEVETTQEDARKPVSNFDIVEDGDLSLPENETEGLDTTQDGDLEADLHMASAPLPRDGETQETPTEPGSYSDNNKRSDSTSLVTGIEDIQAETHATENEISKEDLPVHSEPAMHVKDTVEPAAEPAVHLEAVTNGISSTSDHGSLQEETRKADIGPTEAAFSEDETSPQEPTAGVDVLDAAEEGGDGDGDDDSDGVESATPQNEAEDVNKLENESESNDILRRGQFANIVTSEPVEGIEGEDGDETAPDTASSLANDDRSIDTLPSVSVDSDDIGPAAAEHVVGEHAYEAKLPNDEAFRDAVVDDDKEDNKETETWVTREAEPTEASNVSKEDTSAVEDQTTV